MDEQRIARINALYHKAKQEGLTDAEAAEQKKLRSDYILAVRQNLRGTLNQISIQNPDGTVTPLNPKDKGRD